MQDSFFNPAYFSFFSIFFSNSMKYPNFLSSILSYFLINRMKISIAFLSNILYNEKCVSIGHDFGMSDKCIL